MKGGILKFLFFIFLFFSLIACSSHERPRNEISKQRDTTPPSDVSDVELKTGDGYIILTWRNPADRDFAGVLIRRKLQTYPSSPSEGVTVYDGKSTQFKDSGLTNGVTYYYGIFAYDKSGNYSHGKFVKGTPMIAIDTIITSHPPAITTSTTATFEFKSNVTNASFKCSLDIGYWYDCSSPQTYKGLFYGKHTFFVMAYLPSGSEDLTPASYTWEIGTGESGGGGSNIAPETYMMGAAAFEGNWRDVCMYGQGEYDYLGDYGYTNKRNVCAEVYVNEANSTVQCSLDGGAWQSSCVKLQERGGSYTEAIIVYENLSDGQHTLEVRGISEGGVPDPTPAQLIWTIDTIPPDTFIDSHPPHYVDAISHEIEVSFTFHSSEQKSNFQCSVNGSEWSYCSSPYKMRIKKSGSYTFSVRAIDFAHNVDPTPASYSFTVTLPPETYLLSYPEKVTSFLSATFDFSSSSTEAEFYCKLDSGDWQSCSSPVTYSDLSEGIHYFYVKSKDLNTGKEDLTPATYFWEITTPSQKSWMEVSVGSDHICAVRTSGDLYCWGKNHNGELGISTDSSFVTSPVLVGSSWKYVSAGDGYTCGIKEDNSLWCWGENNKGQLGTGDTDSRDAPTQIEGSSDWKLVAAGIDHTCGIKKNTSLWCWGNNYFGEVGNGEERNIIKYPVKVSGTGWKYVAVGSMHTCAVKDDGSMWCWGCGDGCSKYPHQVYKNELWRLIDNSSDHVECALAGSNTLWCWGDNSYGELGVGKNVDSSDDPVLLSGQWSFVSANDRTIFAIDTSGRVYIWGIGNFWKKVNTYVYAASSGYSEENNGYIKYFYPHLFDDTQFWLSLSGNNGTECGIDNFGSLYCSGKNRFGELGIGEMGTKLSPTQVENSVRWQKIAVGDKSSCGIDENNYLYCWGDNENARIGNGTFFDSEVPIKVGNDKWKDVSTSEYHTCGVKVDGTLWCWGENYIESCDIWWGCKRVGPYLGVGSYANYLTYPAEVTMDTGGWETVSSSLLFSCGIKDDNSLWCWGDNRFGQTGTGNFSFLVTMPEQVNGEWLKVSTGVIHACGIQTDSTLWCWGHGYGGELGIGQRGDFADPQQVSGAWKDVSASGAHTCGIKTDGSLWCWGNNDMGELGIGKYSDYVTKPVQVGSDYDWEYVFTGSSYDEDTLKSYEWSCAVKTSGDLYCWGSNFAGNLGIGEYGGSVSDPTFVGKISYSDISIGGDHGCFISSSDDSLWCWGDNRYGQLGDGTAWKEEFQEVKIR